MRDIGFALRYIPQTRLLGSGLLIAAGALEIIELGKRKDPEPEEEQVEEEVVALKKPTMMESSGA